MPSHLAPISLGHGQSPQEVVDAITGRAKSSFSLGMKLLSRPRREAMRAVYAFCRVVDDIADGDLPEAEKLQLLGQWREEVDALYRGEARSDVGRALIGPVERYQLPKSEFLLMIDGMEMDARGPIHAPSGTELATYTRCVAGSVGMLSMRIFGAWKGDVSETFALALADALQLTNILRDVEEDAEIGRIYLPRELLEHHGVAPDCGTIAAAPGLVAVCRDLGARAQTHFDTALGLVNRHERLPLAPALAMLGIYQAYLRQMRQAAWHRTGPLQMSKLAKLYHGLSAVAVAGRGR